MTADARVALGCMERVLTGAADRDLGEVREHLAFLETRLPREVRDEIIQAFGGLLSPDPPGPPRQAGDDANSTRSAAG